MIVSKGVCPLCRNAYEKSEYSPNYGKVICCDCIFLLWIGKSSKISDKPKYEADDDDD